LSFPGKHTKGGNESSNQKKNSGLEKKLKDAEMRDQFILENVTCQTISEFFERCSG